MENQSDTKSWSQCGQYSREPHNRWYQISEFTRRVHHDLVGSDGSKVGQTLDYVVLATPYDMRRPATKYEVHEHHLYK